MMPATLRCARRCLLHPQKKRDRRRQISLLRHLIHEVQHQTQRLRGIKQKRASSERGSKKMGNLLLRHLSLWRQ